jgi:hypothetical protein
MHRAATREVPAPPILILTLVLASALMTVGCSAGRRWGSRDRVGSDPSTLGTDFHSVPAGRTIPPAGLGVDLVRRDRSPAARRDVSVVPVVEPPALR